MKKRTWKNMMKKVASFLKEKRRWVWLSGFLGILLIAGSIYAVWYNSHPIGRKWRINTERINRIRNSKKYRYFKCPKCKKLLRIPRGVGSVTITCKDCGTKFDKKA